MPMKLSTRAQLVASAGLAYLMAGCASVSYVSPPSNPVNPSFVGEAKANARSISVLPSYSPKVGGWFDCRRLSTQPGSKWVVTEKEPVLGSGSALMLKVGIGVDCTNAKWLIESSGPMLGLDTKLEFTAGGGTYLILFREALGIQNTFEFEVNEINGPAQFAAIAPGVPDYVAPAGTASTVASASGSKYGAGDSFSDCPTCPKMIALPAGTFMMGSESFEEGRAASEGPRHSVTLKRPFAIGATEVTFDQYDACVKALACAPVADQGWGRGSRPVINVTLDEAMKYVAWLSGTTGHHYFIPSEAEWEYAARAGTESPWNTGDAIISEDANFLSQFQKTVPVASYPPNGFGLHDMHGNVAEMVQDCLDTGYLGVPNDGSAALGTPCTTRIVRGGHFASAHAHVRSAVRLTVTPNSRDVGTGFRVTRALPN